jgi:RNA polymerase sigma factor (TIGR02999 family)
MADSGEQAETPLTKVLAAAGAGDRQAASELLPLVYDALRELARARLAAAPPGVTLQPTALVHEAYIKLVGKADPGWDGRAHFFGAAAQAMRDILVDQARRRSSLKRGGNAQRVDDFEPVIEEPSVDILALHDALTELEQQDERKARVVMLHFFAGLTLEETAAALKISVPTVQREWRFTRSLLFTRLGGESRSQ